MENLACILIEQLKDIYSAEKQLVEALPKAAKACSTTELKAAFEAHLEETKEHEKRLDEVGKILEEKLDGETCVAMKGLIKEADDIIKEEHEDPALGDVMLISIAQKIEHYEIAAYGNAHTIASHLGLNDVCRLLNDTLDEEKNADETLSEVTQDNILPSYEGDAADEEDNEIEGKNSTRL